MKYEMKYRVTWVRNISYSAALPAGPAAHKAMRWRPAGDIKEIIMDRIAFLVIAVLLTLPAQCQIITTIAGNGLIDNTGDGGLATVAKISYPGGGTFDKKGNYYFVTSSTGNTVRKVTPEGIIRTVAGTGVAGYSGDNGPATAAKLKTTQAVAVDTSGNLYIADAGNNRVRKVDAVSGIITTIAGTGVGGFSGDGGQATAADILNPLDICFDSKGNLYIAQNASARVRKVNVAGVISTILGTGVLVSSPGGGKADTTPIVGVSGLCVDKNDNLYLADWQSRVYKIDALGFITTVAGNGISTYSGDGGQATVASTVPMKVGVDGSGNLFIAEYDLDRVRKVSSTGIITTVTGNGTAGYSGDNGICTDAQLNHPGGIAFDTCNNLYISDTRNHRIRKIAFNPDCLPISVKDVHGNEATSVTLHPNPATETLTITAGVEIETVAILNAVGQCVVRRAGSGERQLPVDLSGLPPGVYMVRVNEVWAGKFVKE